MAFELYNVVNKTGESQYPSYANEGGDANQIKPNLLTYLDAINLSQPIVQCQFELVFSRWPRTIFFAKGVNIPGVSTNVIEINHAGFTINIPANSYYENTEIQMTIIADKEGYHYYDWRNLVMQTGHPLVAGDPRATIGNEYNLGDEDMLEVKLRNKPTDEVYHHWKIHNFHPTKIGELELSHDSEGFVEFEITGTFTHIDYDCGPTPLKVLREKTPTQDEKKPQIDKQEDSTESSLDSSQSASAPDSSGSQNNSSPNSSPDSSSNSSSDSSQDSSGSQAGSSPDSSGSHASSSPDSSGSQANSSADSSGSQANSSTDSSASQANSSLDSSNSSIDSSLDSSLDSTGSNADSTGSGANPNTNGGNGGNGGGGSGSGSHPGTGGGGSGGGGNVDFDHGGGADSSGGGNVDFNHGGSADSSNGHNVNFNNSSSPDSTGSQADSSYDSTISNIPNDPQKYPPRKLVTFITGIPSSVNVTGFNVSFESIAMAKLGRTGEDRSSKVQAVSDSAVQKLKFLIANAQSKIQKIAEQNDDENSSPQTINESIVVYTRIPSKNQSSNDENTDKLVFTYDVTGSVSSEEKAFEVQSVLNKLNWSVNEVMDDYTNLKVKTEIVLDGASKEKYENIETQVGEGTQGQSEIDEIYYLNDAIRFNHDIYENESYYLDVNQEQETENYKMKITQLTLPHRFGIYSQQNVKNTKIKTSVELDVPDNQDYSENDESYAENVFDDPDHKVRSIF